MGMWMRNPFLFFKHDVLLANGKEFVHDHLVHVMSALTLALDSGTFENEGEKMTYAVMKEQTRAYIKESYDGLEPYKQKLRELRKQIQSGANFSTAEIREMKLRHNRTLTLCMLMETLLSGVVDTLASYNNYETVMGNVRTPMNETLVYLLQNEQWGAHLLSMTDARGVTLFEPEGLRYGFRWSMRLYRGPIIPSWAPLSGVSFNKYFNHYFLILKPLISPFISSVFMLYSFRNLGGF